MRHEWTASRLRPVGRSGVSQYAIETTSDGFDPFRLWRDGRRLDNDDDGFSIAGEDLLSEILRLAEREKALEAGIERIAAQSRVEGVTDRANARIFALEAERDAFDEGLKLLGEQLDERSSKVLALEAENAALRKALEAAAPIVGSVEDGAEDPRALHGETRWASVYGGGEHCSDGEPHRPSLSQSGGIVRCARCGHPLGQA